MKERTILGNRQDTGKQKAKSKKQKGPSINAEALNMVGEEGFEPPTLWSQTRCATKLRYSPERWVYYSL